MAWQDDGTWWEPPADFVPVIVDRPSPACFEPNKLCVASAEACPHALTPVLGRRGYSLTRCARDHGRELDAATIAAVLGVSNTWVRKVEQAALDKIRAAAAKDWSDESWA